MKRKKIIIGAAVVLLIALIIGGNIYKNSKDKGISVQTFKVKKENLEQVVLASGKVEVSNKRELTAQTSATVQRVFVEVGDRVKSGQVLVKLDTTELERQLKQDQANLAVQQANLAKANTGARSQVIEQDKASLTKAETVLNNAKLKLDRSTQLYNQGAISSESLEADKLAYVSAQTEYRTAQERLSLDRSGATGQELAALQAQVQQARLAVQLAQEQIDKASVKAPIEGVVLSLDTEEGSYVNVGTRLVSVGDRSRLIVKSEVSETDSNNLRVGQPVTITAAAVEEGSYKGKVTRVSPVATTSMKDQAEQTNVEITVEIIKFDNRLRPGYNVDLNISTANLKKVPVIPYEAIVEKGSSKSVFVLKDNHVSLKKIEVGVGNELYQHVKKGLNEGEVVVINPPDKLKDKDLVSAEAATTVAAGEKQ